MKYIMLFEEFSQMKDIMFPSKENLALFVRRSITFPQLINLTISEDPEDGEQVTDEMVEDTLDVALKAAKANELAFAFFFDKNKNFENLVKTQGWDILEELNPQEDEDLGTIYVLVKRGNLTADKSKELASLTNQMKNLRDNPQSGTSVSADGSLQMKGEPIPEEIVEKIRECLEEMEGLEIMFCRKDSPELIYKFNTENGVNVFDASIVVEEATNMIITCTVATRNISNSTAKTEGLSERLENALYDTLTKTIMELGNETLKRKQEADTVVGGKGQPSLMIGPGFSDN